MAKTLYQILNVSESANDIELHQAFKTLEQQLTSGGDSANRLESVREAFLALSDPARRIDYDRKLAASRLPPQTLESPRQNALLAWLQTPAVLMALVAACALLVYWNIESQKIRQAESANIADRQISLYKAKETATQEELARQNQQLFEQQQAELENKRIETEQSLQRQANDSYQAVNEQLLKNQALQNEHALNLMEKQTDMDMRRQEFDMAEKKLELQYRKPALAMELKQQTEQNAALTRQRALQQHDANIQSIKDLQAAKLREYDRNHYGSGGNISKTNPVYEQ